MKGRELVVECRNVPREICMDESLLLETLKQASEIMGVRVITSASHNCGQQSPPGAICFVMVDMSFLYIHTFADEGLMSIRIFTCGKGNQETGWEHVRDSLKIKDFSMRVIE